MKPLEQEKNKINMLINRNLTIGTAVANQSGAMEADTISKNGRSSKSHTSRRNKYSLVIFVCLFCFATFSTYAQDTKLRVAVIVKELLTYLLK